MTIIARLMIFALPMAGANAWAGAYSAIDVLHQFNLVVLGNVNSNSEVEGRVLIGGNLSGSGATFDTRPLPPSPYSALTIGGKINTSGYVNVNNGGAVAVDGDVSYMNLNGGSAKISGKVKGNVNGPVQTNATVSIPDFGPMLGRLSGDLSTLKANSNVAISDKTAYFNAAPDASGLAVFNISDPSFFTKFGQISFNANGAGSIIINLDLESATIDANFLGGMATKIAPNVIWNFTKATQLTFNTEFGGAVLALQAAVSNYASIDGMLAAASLTQRGELHQYQFAGTLPGTASAPEPGGLILWGLALAFIARRRRLDPCVIRANAA